MPPVAQSSHAGVGRSRRCGCPEAIVRGARCGPQIPVGLRAKQPSRGSVRRPGCEWEQPCRTLRLTVASMTHRPGRPLAQGAGERACASTSHAAAAAPAPAGAVAPSTWCLRQGTSTRGPPGRCSSWSRSVRSLVVVPTGNEVVVALRLRSHWRSSSQPSERGDWRNCAVATKRSRDVPRRRWHGPARGAPTPWHRARCAHCRRFCSWRRAGSSPCAGRDPRSCSRSVGSGPRKST